MRIPDEVPDVILTFIPRFEAGEFDNASSHYLTTEQDLPQVNDLHEVLYASGLVQPFEWVSWWRSEGKSLAEFNSREGYTLEVLVKIATFWVRADRFSGGAFSQVCSSGQFLSFLRVMAGLQKD